MFLFVLKTSYKNLCCLLEIILTTYNSQIFNEIIMFCPALFQERCGIVCQFLKILYKIHYTKHRRHYYVFYLKKENPASPLSVNVEKVIPGNVTYTDIKNLSAEKNLTCSVQFVLIKPNIKLICGGIVL